MNLTFEVVRSGINKNQPLDFALFNICEFESGYNKILRVNQQNAPVNSSSVFNETLNQTEEQTKIIFSYGQFLTTDILTLSCKEIPLKTLYARLQGKKYLIQRLTLYQNESTQIRKQILQPVYKIDRKINGDLREVDLSNEQIPPTQYLDNVLRFNKEYLFSDENCFRLSVIPVNNQKMTIACNIEILNQ